MKNAVALRNLCNAIANTFYPDKATIDLALFNEGIEAEANAVAKDEKLFRIAVSLVMGYVESSRSENGVRYWCNTYGLDADEILSDYLRVMEDGSKLW